MNMNRFQMVSGLLCLLAASAAQNAQADPGADWNGCYAGVHGGYGTARIGGVDTANNNSIGSATAEGSVIGGQAGCDRQSANWVVGAQFSADKGFMSGSHPYVRGSGPSDRVTYYVNYLASITGRVGYVFQPEMFAYLKAGSAMTRTDHNDSDPTPLAGPSYAGNKEVTRSGWLIGIGLERKIGNDLSAFVEFNHMDFGSKNISIAYSDGVIATYSFTQKVSYLGLGVNYRF